MGAPLIERLQEFIATVARAEKSRTDQQQDDICLGDLPVNLSFPIGASPYLTVVPDPDEAAVHHGRKMLGQLRTHFFVLVAVGDEDLECPDRGPA